MTLQQLRYIIEIAQSGSISDCSTASRLARWMANRLGTCSNPAGYQNPSNPRGRITARSAG